MEAAKPRIEAQKALSSALMERREFTPESWFDQTMYATGGTPVNLEKGEWIGGDRELAEKRHNDAIIRQMDQHQGQQ